MQLAIKQAEIYKAASVCLLQEENAHTLPDQNAYIGLYVASSSMWHKLAISNRHECVMFFVVKSLLHTHVFRAL